MVPARQAAISDDMPLATIYASASGAPVTLTHKEVLEKGTWPFVSAVLDKKPITFDCQPW